MSTELIERVRSEFYTYAHAAKALGISKVTLWRWINAGKIQGYQLGREVMIEKIEVERLKKKGLVP